MIFQCFSVSPGKLETLLILASHEIFAAVPHKFQTSASLWTHSMIYLEGLRASTNMGLCMCAILFDAVTDSSQSSHCESFRAPALRSSREENRSTTDDNVYFKKEKNNPTFYLACIGYPQVIYT